MAAQKNTPSEQKFRTCSKCDLGFFRGSEYAEHLNSETHKAGVVEKYEEEISDSDDSGKYGPREMLYYNRREESSDNIKKVQTAELKVQDMSSIEGELEECIRKLESLNASMKHALSSLRNQKEERLERMMLKYPQMIITKAEAKDGEASKEYIFCAGCTAAFGDPDSAEQHFEKNEHDKRLVEAPKLE